MTTQDLQGLANELAPGAQVRDPGAFLAFLEQEGAKFQSGAAPSQVVEAQSAPQSGGGGGFFDFLTDSFITDGVLDNLRDQGLFGRIGANVLGELTSPLGIASTALLASGIGAPIGASIKAATGARAAAATARGVQASRGARALAAGGRAAEGILTPVSASARGLRPREILSSPGILGRSLAAEAAVGAGAIAGGGLAQAVGQEIPGPTRSVPGQIGLGLAGGLAGSGLAVSGANRVLNPEAQVAAARAAANPIEAQTPELAAIRQRMELTTKTNEQLAEELRVMQGKGAAIGTKRAESAPDPRQAAIDFRSGQSGLRLDRGKFEPLADLPEGARLKDGIPTEPAVPTPFAAEAGITPETFERVGDRIAEVYGRTGFQSSNAQEAFYSLMFGKVPTPSQYELLEPVLGGAFVNQIKEQSRTRGQRGLKLLTDTLQLPLSIMASFDMSAILRQGLVGTVAHPKRSLIGKDSAVIRAIKAATSDENASQIEQQLKNDPRLAPFIDPNLPRGQRLEITDAVSRPEEQFMSGWVEKIPLISHSARFYSAYLNQLRASMVIDYAAKLKAQGIELTPDAIRTANQWANAITGRGTLPLGLESRNNQFATAIRTGLSVGMWSPGLLASRFQSLIRGGRAFKDIRADDPAVRQISRDIARDIAIAAGGISTTLYAAQFLPGVSVQLDPRSSDFGKGRVGDTRFDPWAGFQQIIRYASQFASGTRKSAKDGKIYGVDRDEVIGRFLRSKLAPGGPAILASDLPENFVLGGLTGGGENFIGEPITGGRVNAGAGAEFATLGQAEDLPAELNVLIDNLIPLIAQDIAQAMESDGLSGSAAAGTAAFFGLGSTSYNDKTRSDFVDEQDSSSNVNNIFSGIR